MFQLDQQRATVQNVNVRAEKHGDDSVVATDVNLRSTGGAMSNINPHAAIAELEKEVERLRALLRDERDILLLVYLAGALKEQLRQIVADRLAAIDAAMKESK